MNKKTLKKGISLFIKEPSIFFNLIRNDKSKLYYLSWEPKLNFAKDYFEKNKKVMINSEQRYLDLFKEQIATLLNLEETKENVYHFILYLLVRLYQPKILVETGVSRGVSSLFILQALEDNKSGRLYSIDLPLSNYNGGKMGKIKDGVMPNEVGICVSRHLKKRWELILEDSKNELPKLLDRLNKIDFFLHDSEHSYNHMMWEFRTSWPLLKNCGILVSDDTHWNEAFEKFALEQNCDFISGYRNYEKNGTFGLIIKNVIDDKI